MNGRAQEVDLRDLVRTVTRRKWVVIGVAVALTALALVYSYVQTPLYTASAQLIYENQLDMANPLSTGGYVDPTQRQGELTSVASIIASPDLVVSAKNLLGQGTPASSFTVSAAPDSASGQSSSNTVSITAVSPDAQTAARAANAYAEAFTAS